MTLALAVQAKSTNNAMAKVSAYIGLMSGTSMDGVDGVVLDGSLSPPKKCFQFGLIVASVFSALWDTACKLRE
jgi:hypothetical protein